MTHPETQEVVEPRSSLSDDQAAAAFDTMFEDEVDVDDELEAEADEVDDEGDPDPIDDDEDQADEDEDEGEGEPDKPAIAAPASFNAEEKAVFATMTPEQQQAVAAIEQRRNADVTKATQAASEAKRNAEFAARNELVDIQRQFAAEIERKALEAEAFLPQKPNRAMRHSDPQTYDYMLDAYEEAQAYRENVSRQAAHARAQAEQMQAHVEEQDRQQQRAILLNAIPEWADDAKRAAMLKEMTEVAKGYGFDDDALSAADAHEIITLKAIAADKAELIALRDEVAKYRGKNMARVRSFKGKPPIAVSPGAAHPKGSGQRREFAATMSRLKTTGSDDDAMAAMKALGI